MNPFEIHGPIYLPIYAVICGVAFLLTSKFKQQLLSDSENTSEAKITAIAHNLNPYQAAYLSGGVERVFLAVCGVLARKKLIEINKATSKISQVTKAGNEPLPVEGIEKAVLERLRSKEQTALTCKGTVTTSCRNIREELAGEGLMLLEDRQTEVRLITGGLYIAICLFFSVPKFFIAMQMHLPFGILALASVIAVACSCKLFRSEGEITEKGKRVLNRLQDDNSALKLTHATNPASLSMADGVLAYGIFGAMAFSDPFLDAQMALRRNGAVNNGAGGSGCGSSCGGGCGGGCGGCGG